MRRRLRRKIRWSRWGAGLCVVVLPWLGAPSASSAARARHAAALRAVYEAQAQVALLMRRHPVGAGRALDAASMRGGLGEIREAIERSHGALRAEVPGFARAIECELDAGLAQLDDDGALLEEDRSEFVVSALLPLASSLDDARTALLPAAP